VWVLLYRSLLQEIKGIIIASFIMLVFGIIDDWRELSILAKFLVQIIATTLMIAFGVRTQIAYIGNLANIIITFIWVLGISNAFNHLDVIDGLASGTAIIVSCAFFIISFLGGDIKNVILVLALSGAIFSFFIYNLPPAKIYMGNSGSHFLGFVLAAIALAISYAPLERKVALLSPLLILGFPIFDTVFLILMRLKQGRSVFKKSNDHLALRFLKMGYSKVKTLKAMLSLCLFFCLCGIVVSQVSNQWGITTIAFVVLVIFVLTKKMGKIQI
jgi:UDP-GlcNAc:undecaprenyl-phosphate GlcNAc-1-phosphate transferase